MKIVNGQLNIIECEIPPKGIIIHRKKRNHPNFYFYIYTPPHTKYIDYLNHTNRTSREGLAGLSS